MPIFRLDARRLRQEPAEQFRQIRTIVTPDGERLPLLMRRGGVPDHQSTLFILAEVRARNLSCSAIDKALRAIAILYRFLQSKKANLEVRIRSGRLFTLQELDALVRLCRARAHEDPSADGHPLLWTPPRNGERRGSRSPKFVSQATTANRLQVIRDFVIWSIKTTNSLSIDVEALTNDFRKLIDGRAPPVRRTSSSVREGLAVDEAQAVIEVASPGAIENPWSDEYVRRRNYLIILWLLRLGMRRGELLGVKISDIDFVLCRVTIHRRADDVEDPRVAQPNAKTLPRELELERELLELTEDYVINDRSKLSGARQHDFLFVASHTGDPLSTSSITKLFRVLSAHPALLGSSLCAHLLRHTWNERFSEIVDERGVPEETEKRVRSYLMGWSDISKSAAWYTRRHVKKKAANISVAMQRSALGRRSS